jgi:Putative Actinobacterial Holin-X, holin superfamily III
VDEFSNTRSLVDIISDMRKEFQEFVQTRLELFRREVRQKIKFLKLAVPLAATALALLFTAYLLFTAALVSLVVVAFEGNPYRWFFAFVVVAAAWVVLGGTAAFLAKRQFELNQLLPSETIEVLRGDKFWIKEETKSTNYEQRAS